MSVKMPVLGQPARRKSSGLGWVLFLGLAVAAGGYLWHQRHPPAAPPVAQVPVVAPAPVITAPGSTAVPGVAQAPVPPPVQTGPRFLSVRIDGPVEAALVAGAGTDTGPALTQVVKRVLVWWIAVPADLRKGDLLEVVYEPQPGQEPLVSSVRLQSAKAGRTFEAYRFKPAGAQFARFYDAEGGDLELRLDPSPLDSWEQITSLLKDGRKHKGVDFKTPVGTPVKATFDGTITRKNWFFRGNGNSLEVTQAGRAAHEGDLPPSLRASANLDRRNEGEGGRGHRAQREQRAQLRPSPALPADVPVGPGAGPLRRAGDEEGEPRRGGQAGADRAGGEVAVDDDHPGRRQPVPGRRARGCRGNAPARGHLGRNRAGLRAFTLKKTATDPRWLEAALIGPSAHPADTPLRWSSPPASRSPSRAT